MALFVFTTRNNVKFTIGYQKCDNCTFMKPCIYGNEDAYLCKECIDSAVASFERINKADIKPKLIERNADTLKQLDKGVHSNRPKEY